MDDLEMTRLCAEAMGLTLRDGVDESIQPFIWPPHPVWHTAPWNPLHDDAQAMALVKRCRVHIIIYDELDGRPSGWWRVDSQGPYPQTSRHADLNRAIVECVANIQAAKVKP